MNVNGSDSDRIEPSADVDAELESVIRVLVPCLFTLIILIGFVGNSLVIAVFALNHSMRNSTNILILNLATADLAFVLFCVPFTAAQYSISHWPFGEFWCKAVTYLQYTSALASVWTLVLMAVERFLAVAYPIQAALSIRSMRTAAISIAALWAAILVSQTYIFAAQGIYEYEFAGGNRSACVFKAQIGRDWDARLKVRLHYWSFNLLAFFLPLSITSVLYALMVKELWKNKLKLQLSETSLNMKRRITTMVFSVTLVFTICWLPQNILFIWQAAIFPVQAVTSPPALALQLTAQILSYTNSCVNPILYGTLSTNFRHGFENALSLALRGKTRHRLQRQDSSKARETKLSSRKTSVRSRLMRTLSKSTLLRRQTTQETLKVDSGSKRPSLPALKPDTISHSDPSHHNESPPPAPRRKISSPARRRPPSTKRIDEVRKLEPKGLKPIHLTPEVSSIGNNQSISREETWHLSDSEHCPILSHSQDHVPSNHDDDDETMEQFV